MIRSRLAVLMPGMDETDLNRVMDRYACGETAAFAALHRALYPRLHAYLLRMRGSAHVADDLVQETFLRMHRARATFAPGASVVPWMYTIARNVLIDHTRSARRRATSELPEGDAYEPVDTGADTESSAFASEAARTVERVLARLPPAQREAFVLLRYEGLSVADAANVLGATPAAVKLRAFRAYEALRAALAEKAENPSAEKATSAEKPAAPGLVQQKVRARGAEESP
ncbi:MAG: RNA polymerase sigma factor [Polyangiaceae bacterium]